jgi:hypothetical protein
MTRRHFGVRCPGSHAATLAPSSITPEVPATSRRIAMAERPDPPHVQFGWPGLVTGTRQPRCR